MILILMTTVRLGYESSCVLEFWILAVFFSAIVVRKGDLLGVMALVCKS